MAAGKWMVTQGDERMGEVERQVARATRQTDPLHPNRVLWRWWNTIRYLDAGWLLTLGIMLFWGGRPRMGGPSLHGLMYVSDRLDLDPRIWALPPLLAGVALLLGVVCDRFWLRTAAYVLATLFSLTFAVGGAYAIPQSPTAASSGPPTYLFTAALQLAFLYASVQVAVLRQVR